MIIHFHVHKRKELVNVFLKEMDYVLDVRRIPYSKYAKQYNRETLDRYLLQHHIHYTYMGTYFGARQANPALYTPDGYVDFEKVRSTPLFVMGMKIVEKGLLQRHEIALMCTEKEPLNCHRAIMVARAFELGGYDIKHILFDDSLLDQRELNDQLLSKYFQNSDQMTLFANDEFHSTNGLLKQAYIMRNKEIGYRLKCTK